jgi:fatty-acyl-CoA synthase
MSSELRRQNIADLLRRSAARYPNRVAIVCAQTCWTYAQFSALCDRLATGLAAVGIAPSDRVAVLARNSHAFAALRFAVARLGAVLVPVNFMLNAQEVRYILQHSGARLLATDSELTSIARIAVAGTSIEQSLWLPSEQFSSPELGMLDFNEIAQCDDAPPEVDLGSGDIAQIIYTSGTESLPKGVVLTHEAIIHQYVSCIVNGEMSSDDRVLHSLPLYHCAQLDCFLGPSVYLGSTSIITALPMADNLLALIAEHQITSFFAPPTVWISLLRSPHFDGSNLSSLRKGYYGASIMPIEVLREILRRLPAVRLWNFYGQTEIAPLATVLRPEDQLRKSGSAGRPVLNVETRVVDDALNDVNPGEVGEIVHRSPQLMQGYYKDEERTAQAFAGGWFHSGDLARIDAEGYITIVDRIKDVIKSGGENVASREVEEVIYSMPQVSEVAVIGLPHPRWIEAVVAVVVVKPLEQLLESQVMEHCAERLAHFKAPKGVIFVDALPKNPSGKILKRELRQRFANFINWHSLCQRDRSPH